ncbi:MAG: ROK family transcriptional regulator [Bacteroidota bacterium]
MKDLPKGNALYINRLNKIKVLQLIRNESGISRADIVKKTGLTAPTITRIVESLVNEEKLATFVGQGSSTGGRPPLIVKFDGENNFIIGIDIGATNIRGVLSNLNAEFLVEIQVPTEKEKEYNRVMEQVGAVIEKLCIRKNIDKSRILGVGIALGGLINQKEKIVEYSPNLEWHHVDISNSLSQYVDCPVIFQNVSKCMALGELWFGKGKTYEDFIVINVGYGIGSGIIIDRKLLDGIDGIAGEFGHITMEANSDVQCRCGKMGCLEALSSGMGIELAVRKKLNEGMQSEILGVLDSEGAKAVFEAYRQGDRLAQEVIDRAMEFLGRGIAHLISIFNPEAVFIGGGLANSKDILFDSVSRHVKSNVMSQAKRNPNILLTTYGENAALMGAFSMILYKVLRLELGVNSPAIHTEEEYVL